MKTIKITSFADNQKKTVFDQVTEECQLTIETGKKQLTKLWCSPVHLKELVVGFLYTSGVVRNLSEIRELDFKTHRSEVTAIVNIEMGGRLSLRPSLSPKHRNNRQTFCVAGSNIIELMRRFQTHSSEFMQTGGVHSAALCNEKEILFFKEDLGRHNALDKIIGEALLNGSELQDKLVLTSGRIPTEILRKVVVCEIPLIASVSAPTYQAVQLARKAEVTVIGFVRNNRMNIYSGQERIT